MQTVVMILVAALAMQVQAQARALGDEVETTLRGSPESMERQHRVAVQEDLTFVGTLEEMEALVDEGYLTPIRGGRDYEVMDWVFPYALPEVRTFIEHFAHYYHRACGEPLVVTSLTRPFSEQPRNAHQLSVHPAGMAVDLRISQTQACREYLETALLAQEDMGLLDITRERSPPHYHIAIFPTMFTAWAEAYLPELPVEEPEPEEEEPVGVPLWLMALGALAVVAALGAAYALGAARR